MNGSSEKQINWATDIRAGLTPNYTETIALLRAGEYGKAMPSAAGKLLREGQANAGHAPIIAAALETLMSDANASFWIDHRNGVQGVVSQMMDYLRRGKPVIYGKWVS